MFARALLAVALGVWPITGRALAQIAPADGCPHLRTQTVPAEITYGPFISCPQGLRITLNGVRLSGGDGGLCPSFAVVCYPYDTVVRDPAWDTSVAADGNGMCSRIDFECTYDSILFIPISGSYCRVWRRTDFAGPTNYKVVPC